MTPDYARLILDIQEPEQGSKLNPGWEPNYSQAQMRQDFMAGLIRRKEQKIINAIGAYLDKETLSMDELMSLKPRLRCEVAVHDQAEHYYIDQHHLITFQPPTFTMEGNVMTAHQAYGPVAV